VSLTAHILPLVFVLVLWFVGTGAVVWLDRPARAAGGNGSTSFIVAAVFAIGGLMAVFALADIAAPWAAYAGFVAAFLIWGWHELAFLTGRTAGPRRAPCPADARGWTRFRLSALTLLHHEIALAATLALLFVLSWGAVNQVAALVFAVLFGMRLSTKLNIFLGVPNFSTEILPTRLAYLQTYFRSRAMNPLMPVSLIAGGALTAWFANTALASSGDAAVGWSLLTGLALLGVIEHLFLVLPLRDGALWRWAMRPRAIEL